MNIRNQLSPRPGRGNGQEDEVDQILSTFFRSAMPDPWPAWKTPAAATAAPPSSHRRSLFWSRFALAASVALLLASQLWLVHSYRPPEPAEATERARPVDVATKPQVSNSDMETDPETTNGGLPPARPVLKKMR